MKAAIYYSEEVGDIVLLNYDKMYNEDFFMQQDHGHSGLMREERVFELLINNSYELIGYTDV